MTRRDASPLRRFLPDADPDRGPFGVLGVTPEACDAETVVAALRRALERVTRHPESRTPEAEEVRLALHVAAAQLIDPQTRSAMIELWSSPAPATAVITEAPSARAPRAAPAGPRGHGEANLGAFRLACFEVLAHSGGFNARARRRLIALADVFGLSPADLQRVFVPTNPAGAPTATIAMEPRAVTPTKPREPRDLTGRRRITILTLAALILVNVIASIALVRVVWPQAQAKKSIKAESKQSAGAITSPAIAPVSGAGSIPVDTRTLLQRLRELRDTDIVRRGEQAIDDYLGAHDTLTATWPTLPPRDIEAVARLDDEIIDTIDAYERPSLDRVFEHFNEILTTDDHTRYRGAAWVAASMTRLANDTRVSSVVRDRAVMLLHDASIDAVREPGIAVRRSLHLGMLFGASVAATAFTTPTPASDTAEVWKSWIADATVLATWDADPSQSILIDGFERLAAVSPSPSGARALETQMRAVLNAIDWTRSDAQSRLMSWLTDESILPSTALTIATSAIVAKRSDLEGGSDLVASSDAVGPRREALARRWAEALGLGAPRSRLQDLGIWANASATLLRPQRAPQTTTQWLTMAVQAARLNAAASMLWRQRTAEARALLMNPDWNARDLPPRFPRVSLGVLTRPSEPRTAAWGERMLNARRDPNERMTLLQEYRRIDRVQSQTDADVLAETAFYDTSIQVRQSAQQVARLFADDPRVIYALFETLPRTGRSENESDTIESVTSRRLPPARHPQWRDAAASALLARLFELEGAYIVNEADQAAMELASAYASMTDRSDGDGAPGPGPGPMVVPAGESSDLEIPESPDPPHVHAEALERLLRAEAAQIADPALIIDHDRLQSARRALVGNDIERFAVAQLSCFELMAMITIGERSSQTDAVRALMDSTADARRTSTKLSEQIGVTEVNINRLWAIRMGTEIPE